MINSHELLDNLDRSLRNNDLKSIQTDVSRLKTISPGSWQKMFQPRTANPNF